MRICSVEGCERKHAAKGYCAVHYLRNEKYGDPHIRPLTRWETIESRIMPVPECGCWLWTGHSNVYGLIQENNKNVAAHRLIYEALVEPIPEGMLALHKCDTPLCVNPRHIFLGTQKDNVQDMFNKGRDNRLYGEKHHAAKLTNDEVVEIYKKKKGGAKTKDLAKEYNISQNQIRSIMSGCSQNKVVKQAIISFLKGRE
jgi:hypothetical protein